MNTFAKLAAAATIPALFAAAPVAAQDAETFTLALSGSVDSNCELVPEGSGSFAVDMLETGNQGALTIAYSCNSPYTVSLQSLNGGMRHSESGGAVVIEGLTSFSRVIDTPRGFQLRSKVDIAALEIAGQVTARLVTFLGIFLKRLVDDGREAWPLFYEVRAQLGDLDMCLVCNHVHQGRHRIAGERQFPGNHLVEHHAQ